MTTPTTEAPKPDTSNAQRLGDKLSDALLRAMPGGTKQGFGGDNICRDIDGEHTYCGRGATLTLIEGLAEVTINSAFDGVRIDFKLRDAPDGEWTHFINNVFIEDLPMPEDTGFDGRAKAQAKWLAEKARGMVDAKLRPRWDKLRQAAMLFAVQAPTAALYADFYGNRIEFEYVQGCGPKQRFCIHNGGASGSRRWLSDVPPVDGQDAWAVSLWRSPAIQAVRLRRNDSYSSTYQGRYFMVDSLGGRPKFTGSTKGEILVPEGQLKEFEGGEEYTLIPRNAQTNRLALLATTALELLDSATSKRKIIEATFGDVLKETVTEAASKMERAAKAVATAAEKVEGGPIDGIGDLLGD